MLGAAGLLLRLGWSVVTEFLAVRRDRQRQRARVALVGRPDAVDGAWIVDEPRPSVFCIPGRRDQIVVTTGALAVLTPRQRALALAHERAHLGGRHHVALTVAAALRRAMPRSRFFAIAETEIATLVEMHADDRATAAGGRRDLAAALVALAEGTSPAGALAVNGGAAMQRVHRLVVTAPGLPLGQRWSIHGIAAALVAAPVLIAAAPALETALLDYCAAAFHA
ncbi:M56 family metallopeptidase [Nocardioides sp. TF02-7]|uniref:M56 family metallopeptidase n=1 Tax=Nocardioides sp. TF02-7 TaxID=2917724 RepID=UPI001F0518C0|nr:M56 family metallopeptidase [Nocardioides sp. TF02-7]UMG92240.1 M56 family metallopeptidase [Nocardioides sp. TF02-7]